MYYLKKRIEVAGAHKLNLSYESPCNNLHGHNWIITVFCKCEDHLLKEGMILDFKQIKAIVNLFDHATINDFVEQPTAENIAFFLQNKIDHCYKVTVQETEGNEVTYEL